MLREQSCQYFFLFSLKFTKVSYKLKKYQKKRENYPSLLEKIKQISILICFIEIDYINILYYQKGNVH